MSEKSGNAIFGWLFIYQYFNGLTNTQFSSIFSKILLQNIKHLERVQTSILFMTNLLCFNKLSVGNLLINFWDAIDIWFIWYLIIIKIQILSSLWYASDKIEKQTKKCVLARFLSYEGEKNVKALYGRST